MTAIILLGAGGKLGKAFLRVNPKIKGFLHNELDICDVESVKKVLAEENPKTVINCAALTNSDYCEAHPKKAWQVNVEAVGNLLSECKNIGALLVHFSSDYALAPAGIYSKTKKKGEEIVGKQGLVVRTNIYDLNFWLVSELKAGNKVKLVTTEFLNPISTMGAARITLKLISKRACGIVNVATKKRISYYEFGLAMANALNLDKKLIYAVKSIARNVPRPKDAFLDTKDLRKFHIDTTYIEQDLEKFAHAG